MYKLKLRHGIITKCIPKALELFSKKDHNKVKFTRHIPRACYLATLFRNWWHITDVAHAKRLNLLSVFDANRFYFAGIALHQ